MKLNLGSLGQATTAKELCELGTQTAVAARLSVGSVVWTGSVLRAGVAIRVAHRHWRTTRRHLSCVYVAGGAGGCRCYVGLDACGMSVVAVCLACAQARAWVLVAR